MRIDDILMKARLNINVRMVTRKHQQFTPLSTIH